MKLKGLVWFFAIALILISLYELSYTWVVRGFESKIKAQAEATIRRQYPGVTGDEEVFKTEFSTDGGPWTTMLEGKLHRAKK